MCSPSCLYDPVPSITLPHQPEAHGMASTPCSCSAVVALKLNESLQLPRSPLDRQVKHRFNAPVKQIVYVRFKFQRVCLKKNVLEINF